MRRPLRIEVIQGWLLGLVGLSFLAQAAVDWSASAFDLLLLVLGVVFMVYALVRLRRQR